MKKSIFLVCFLSVTPLPRVLGKERGSGETFAEMVSPDKRAQLVPHRKEKLAERFLIGAAVVGATVATVVAAALLSKKSAVVFKRVEGFTWGDVLPVPGRIFNGDEKERAKLAVQALVASLKEFKGPYYIDFPEFNKATFMRMRNETIEYAMTPAPNLPEKEDKEAFADGLANKDKKKCAVVLKSPNGTKLVVPTGSEDCRPAGQEPANHANLKKFVQTGSAQEVEAYFLEFFEAIEEIMRGTWQKIEMATDGHAVAKLHIRIVVDSRGKVYHPNPFKGRR